MTDLLPNAELQETLNQIQRISATIADLAKSAQLNINDLNYVSRVRSEIATLSSVLISYSVNPEVSQGRIEVDRGKSAMMVTLDQTDHSSAKRKHKSSSSQSLYCRSCGTTQTPEWRRGPDGGKSLCNACGLHYAKIIKREVLVPAKKTEGTAEAMNLRTLLN